jgi:hypothetical protein
MGPDSDGREQRAARGSEGLDRPGTGGRVVRPALRGRRKRKNTVRLGGSAFRGGGDFVGNGGFFSY